MFDDRWAARCKEKDSMPDLRAGSSYGSSGQMLFSLRALIRTTLIFNSSKKLQISQNDIRHLVYLDLFYLLKSDHASDLEHPVYKVTLNNLSILRKMYSSFNSKTIFPLQKF